MAWISGGWSDCRTTSRKKALCSRLTSRRGDPRAPTVRWREVNSFDATTAQHRSRHPALWAPGNALRTVVRFQRRCAPDSPPGGAIRERNRGAVARSKQLRCDNRSRQPCLEYSWHLETHYGPLPASHTLTTRSVLADVRGQRRDSLLVPPLQRRRPVALAAEGVHGGGELRHDVEHIPDHRAVPRAGPRRGTTPNTEDSTAMS